ncbi:uncharacterized protein LOC123510553 [Portunus trituberculatus]|uniref:uncharacterized protein LOC123510553 n=1 Tax=Portunus trituberculatus TaxID=210409 RepID=UPI001E1D020C|nr:uncharacterized protein LOC123510553 [Portunus trituberculatus]
MCKEVVICFLVVLIASSGTAEGDKQPLDPYDIDVLASHYASVSSYPFAKVVGMFSQVDESSCQCQDAWLPCPLEIREKSVVKFRGYSCYTPRRYCCQRKLIPRLSLALHYNLEHLAVTATPLRHTLTEAKKEDVSGSAARTKPSGFTAGSHNHLERHRRTLRGTNEDPKIMNKIPLCSCTTSEKCATLWEAYRDLPKAKIKASLNCTGPREVTCCLGHALTFDERETKRKTTEDSSQGLSIWQTALSGLVSWLG